MRRTVLQRTAPAPWTNRVRARGVANKTRLATRVPDGTPIEDGATPAYGEASACSATEYIRVGIPEVIQHIEQPLAVPLVGEAAVGAYDKTGRALPPSGSGTT